MKEEEKHKSSSRKSLIFPTKPRHFGPSRIYKSLMIVPTLGASLVAQMVKNLPAMQETWVQTLGREDPLEKEMATYSSILPWRIPWTEEPGRLQSMGSQRVGHNWVTNTHSRVSVCTHTHTQAYSKDHHVWVGLLRNVRRGTSPSMIFYKHDHEWHNEHYNLFRFPWYIGKVLIFYSSKE